MSEPRLLLIAVDNWEGSSRLPGMLSAAGFQVGLLSKSESYAARSRFVDSRFVFPAGTHLKNPQSSLCAAIEAFAPKIVVPSDEASVRLMHLVAASGPPAIRLLLQGCLPSKLATDAGRLTILRIAAKVGLACPVNASVNSLRQALVFAEAHGWPVFLKRDHTAGGVGVRICENSAETRAAFAELSGTNRSIWSVSGALRHCRFRLHAIGLVANPRVSIEAAVPGQPAFHTAVALNGKWLAGVSAEVEEFQRPTGSSTRVCLHHDDEMDAAARALIAATGYTGFCGLDFIRRPDGKLTFLEFNLRPTPVTHLGGLVGSDLAAALLGALSGKTIAPPVPRPPLRVALFPQDWIRDPHDHHRKEYYNDIPANDPSLTAALSTCLSVPLGETATNDG